MNLSKGKTWLAALILVTLISAATGWVLLHRSRPDSSTLREEVAGRLSLPDYKAQPTTGTGPSVPDRSVAMDASIARTPATGTLGAAPSVPAQRSVYTSRLVGRPGYYPPDDPESLSVLTGRREAPAVDLELSGGEASLEALGRAVVAAVTESNQSALDGLRVTKHEFRVICWPEFPESRPITSITLDDAWMMAAAKSHAGSSRAAGTYGGRNLELVNMEIPRPFAYRNFTRYSGLVLVARDRNSGEVLRLTFAPSVIERHGQFKVLMYRDR